MGASIASAVRTLNSRSPIRFRHARAPRGPLLGLGGAGPKRRRFRPPSRSCLAVPQTALCLRRIRDTGRRAPLPEVALRDFWLFAFGLLGDFASDSNGNSVVRFPGTTLPSKSATARRNERRENRLFSMSLGEYAERRNVSEFSR
jgi:hypothetical protein